MFLSRFRPLLLAAPLLLLPLLAACEYEDHGYDRDDYGWYRDHDYDRDRDHWRDRDDWRDRDRVRDRDDVRRDRDDVKRDRDRDLR